MSQIDQQLVRPIPSTLDDAIKQRILSARASVYGFQGKDPKNATSEEMATVLRWQYASVQARDAAKKMTPAQIAADEAPLIKQEKDAAAARATAAADAAKAKTLGYSNADIMNMGEKPVTGAVPPKSEPHNEVVADVSSATNKLVVKTIDNLMTGGEKVVRDAADGKMPQMPKIPPILPKTDDKTDKTDKKADDKSQADKDKPPGGNPVTDAVDGVKKGLGKLEFNAGSITGGLLGLGGAWLVSSMFGTGPLKLLFTAILMPLFAYLGATKIGPAINGFFSGVSNKVRGITMPKISLPNLGLQPQQAEALQTAVNDFNDKATALHSATLKLLASGTLTTQQQTDLQQTDAQMQASLAQMQGMLAKPMNPQQVQALALLARDSNGKLDQALQANPALAQAVNQELAAARSQPQQGAPAPAPTANPAAPYCPPQGQPTAPYQPNPAAAPYYVQTQVNPVVYGQVYDVRTSMPQGVAYAPVGMPGDPSLAEQVYYGGQGQGQGQGGELNIRTRGGRGISLTLANGMVVQNSEAVGAVVSGLNIATPASQLKVGWRIRN